MVRSDHSLTLTMTTVNVSLEVTPAPGVGHHFSVITPGKLTAYMPEVSVVDLVAWLDDEDSRYGGSREYADPLACHLALHVRKRIHSMTREEVAEFAVADRHLETVNMVILTYPQTRALIAYLSK